jgi:hypothetical protein
MRFFALDRKGDHKIIQAAIALSRVPATNLAELTPEQTAMVDVAEPFIFKIMPISVASGVALVRGPTNPLGEDLLKALVGVANGMRGRVAHDQPEVVARLLSALLAAGERCGLRQHSPCFSYGIVQTATYRNRRGLAVLFGGVWRPDPPRLIFPSSPEGYRTFEFAAAAAALALQDALSGPRH